MAEPVRESSARPVVAFFGLVFVLSGAFYLLGPLFGGLSRWTRGRRGLGDWASGLVRLPRATHLVWYLPALLLPPLVPGDVVPGAALDRCAATGAGHRLVWLYDNAGRSIMAPVLCHASYNVAWSS